MLQKIDLSQARYYDGYSSGTGISANAELPGLEEDMVWKDHIIMAR